MDLELTGKVALVTAASKGIGRAIARRLVVEGASVAVNARPGPALEAALVELSALTPDDGRVVALPADLAEAGSGSRLVGDVIDRFGRLDILVSNSPGPRLMPAIEASDEDWLDAYAKLLRPAVQLSRAAATHMVERGGDRSIVFMTSTWVKEPRHGSVLSSAMRSAVSALSKQMATELAPRGVRVNQVMPGVTATDRIRQIAAGEAARSGATVEEEIARVAAGIPLRRIGVPEEIADAVAFLVSARSGFTTGQSLAIDGGNGRSIL